MHTEEKDTSKRILEAALNLISQNGYAQVSTRDIAQEAGVAISQISYHYKNKEGLFIALIRQLKESFVGDIREKMEGISSSDGFIDFICEYSRESIVKDSDIHRLRLEFSNLAMSSEPFRAEFSVLVGELTEVVASYVARYASNLEIMKTHTPVQTANFIIAFVLGVSTQYLAEGKNARSLETIDILRATMK
ncbi:MAG: TetR/AcrR family transcriptional regulator [Synergistaceae bacterium]|nr:TetR/AcrR family transcriptional regulator [Synergistaceae bacterium]